MPVETSLSRVKARGDLDRFEKEEIEFHKRIRNTYLDLATNNSNRIKIIDSSQKIESMLNNVKKAIEKLFNE